MVLLFSLCNDCSHFGRFCSLEKWKSPENVGFWRFPPFPVKTLPLTLSFARGCERISYNDVWQGLCQGLFRTQKMIVKFGKNPLPLIYQCVFANNFLWTQQGSAQLCRAQVRRQRRSATEQTFHPGTVVVLQNGTGSKETATTAKYRKQRGMARWTGRVGECGEGWYLFCIQNMSRRATKTAAGANRTKEKAE